MQSVFRFCIIGLMLFIPAHATGGVDGNELLKVCGPIEKLSIEPDSLTSSELSGVVYCLGYIDSFIETFQFQQQAKIVPGVPFCLPENEIPKKETAKKVVEYLKNNPDELHKPAGYQLFMALRAAYSCNNEDKSKENENEEVTPN